MAARTRSSSKVILLAWSIAALSIALPAICVDFAFCQGQDYPDPGRFENAIRQFERQDAENPPPAGAIVCIGSSSMRKWHDRIHEDLAPLAIVARGFGGSNMNDALTFADRIVIRYKPRAVVVYEGDNDVAQGVSPEKICDTFRALVRKIHESLPETRIYCLSIKPSIRRWEMWPKMQEANRLLSEECRGDERLTFVDVAGPMLDADGQVKKDIFENDNLHMNRKGYVIWRDTLRPILMRKEGARGKKAGRGPASTSPG